MKIHWKLRRFFPAHLAICLILILAGCGSNDSSETGNAAHGGAIGVVPDIGSQPPLEGMIQSPSGATIEPGLVTETGHTLPLDVLALKKKKDSPMPENDRPAKPSPSDAGSEFVLSVEEHRLSPDDGHTQNETTIDVDGETIIAGWNHYTASSLVMGIARSTDGGHTWSQDVLTGHSVMSDPAVKTGGSGRWYYAYLASGGAGGGDYDIYVRRSTNDGLSWEPPVDASGNTSFDDKPYIDAAGDHVLVGWADFGFSPAKIRTVSSDNGGLTFTNNHILANNSVGGNGACPVIGPEGNDYIFWRDSFQDSLWISRSTDQGANWTPDRGIVGMNPLPSTFPPGYRIINIPSADADPLTGDLLVVWNDQLLGDPDILAIRSTDMGQTWSSPVRVNDDAGLADQFFPWIHIDDNGVAHVVWYDKREDGYNIDLYYARSLDGGSSFEPNIRVTAQSFEPIMPWDTSIDFIGDYNAVSATGATVFPCFQDSRAGEQDIYVALLPNSSSDVDSRDSQPSGGALRLTAAPMPFSHSVRLSLEAETRQPGMNLEIISAGGRRLRTLPLNPGGQAIWDGCDELGRDLPAGVYYARIQGGRIPPTRLVRIR